MGEQLPPKVWQGALSVGLCHLLYPSQARPSGHLHFWAVALSGCPNLPLPDANSFAQKRANSAFQPQICWLSLEHLPLLGTILSLAASKVD